MSAIAGLKEMKDEIHRLKRFPELFLTRRIRKVFFAFLKKILARIKQYLRFETLKNPRVLKLKYARHTASTRPNFSGHIPAQHGSNLWSFFLGNQIRNRHAQHIISESQPRRNFAPLRPQAQNRLSVFPPGALNLFNRWMNDQNTMARDTGMVSIYLIGFLCCIAVEQA